MKSREASRGLGTGGLAWSQNYKEQHVLRGSQVSLLVWLEEIKLRHSLSIRWAECTKRLHPSSYGLKSGACIVTVWCDCSLKPLARVRARGGPGLELHLCHVQPRSWRGRMRKSATKRRDTLTQTTGDEDKKSSIFFFSSYSSSSQNELHWGLWVTNNTPLL